MNNFWTPWGQTQAVHAYHPQRKILEVDTAGHGGIAVAQDLPMPEPLANIGEVANGYRWFEQDEASAAAIVAFPQHFAPCRVVKAKETLRDWMPDAFMAHFGEPLTAENSKLLAKREWENATRDNFVVLAVYGDSHWNIPPGHVYACGFRRSDEATAGFLVPEDKYNANPARTVLDGFPRWEPARSLPYTKAESMPTYVELQQALRDIDAESIFDADPRESPSWGAVKVRCRELLAKLPHQASHVLTG